MKFHGSEEPYTFAFWILVLVTIPSFSLFGRSAQRYLEGTIGSFGIGIMFATVIGLVLLGAGIFIVRGTSNRGLLHLLWVGAVAGAIMLYVAGNPERWYHLPLFGTAGFLTVRLFDLRTGAEISAAIAFSDEFLQFFLPSRTGSVEDVFINAVSAGLGITIWVLLQPDVDGAALSVPSSGGTS